MYKLKNKNILVIILILLSSVTDIIYSEKRIQATKEIIEAKEATIEEIKTQRDFYQSISSPSILEYFKEVKNLHENLISSLKKEKEILTKRVDYLENGSGDPKLIEELKSQKYAIEDHIKKSDEIIIMIDSSINSTKKNYEIIH
jgi:hypothetical protein